MSLSRSVFFSTLVVAAAFGCEMPRMASSSGEAAAGYQITKAAMDETQIGAAGTESPFNDTSEQARVPGQRLRTPGATPYGTMTEQGTIQGTASAPTTTPSGQVNPTDQGTQNEPMTAPNDQGTTNAPMTAPTDDGAPSAQGTAPSGTTTAPNDQGTTNAPSGTTAPNDQPSGTMTAPNDQGSAANAPSGTTNAPNDQGTTTAPNDQGTTNAPTDQGSATNAPSGTNAPNDQGTTTAPPGTTTSPGMTSDGGVPVPGANVP